MCKSIDISIIIPVYNSETYIKRCIDSILSQTFYKFELICIDDGSTDKSLEILYEYDCKDERIKVIKQKNGGPSKARNKGLEVAKGKYVAFVDSDDYLENEYLERLFEKSMENDIIIANYKEETENNKKEIKIFECLLDNKNNSEIIEEILLGSGGYVWGKLFKYSAISENNLKFDENINMCEDLIFIIDFFTKINYIGKSNESMYIYNKCNCNSITTKYKPEMFYIQGQVQEKIKNIINKSKIKFENIDLILANRFKDILMYSIYKESKLNHIQHKTKIKNINEMITSDETIKYIKLFKGSGPVDSMLVKAITNKNATLTYMLTILREKIIYLYNVVN
ncbi:MAG: glycosyltransferase family 2 protein [Clostridium sp.]|uniref:glycosyltransferase family 2 protein n=1 Tax=Clostridium sp. TaxID=1506 RepID=UPI003F2E2B19